jgi:hypothetical protein
VHQFCFEVSPVSDILYPLHRAGKYAEYLGQVVVVLVGAREMGHTVKNHTKEHHRALGLTNQNILWRQNRLPISAKIFTSKTLRS